MWRSLTLTSHSESETVSIGRELGKLAEGGDVALIQGPLGSGKTRLAKGIISAATGTPEEEVVSPTFTLINSYEGPVTVKHADLYRLTPQGVEDIGLEDELDQDDLIVIEWAERLDREFPEGLRIHMDFHQLPDQRLITISRPANCRWGDRLAGIFATDVG
jgi:tRNA threonylcarbamoyl adenosine modification protein YjeE